MKVTILQPDGDALVGTRVLLPDGRELPNVRAVVWRHEAGEAPVAEVELAIAQAQVEGQFRALWGGRALRRIEFADGTAEEFPRASPVEFVDVTHMGSEAREFRRK